MIGLNDSFMLDLAIALKEKGYEEIVGSDETISESNGQRMKEAGISFSTSWNPDGLNKEIDCVIPAAHIEPDNVEILQAQKLNLQIMSIPEFIYDRTKSKTRLVITGSKGKKSLIAIVLNVLKRQKVAFDYVINNSVPGFEKKVSLSYDARIAVIEGDELISSPVRKKHKLEFYRPHIALIPNISWEKSKEFPTEEQYVNVFGDFVRTIERDGKFIYNQEDSTLNEVAAKIREDITAIPYTRHQIVEEGDGIFLDTRFGKYPITTKDSFFLENLNGARNACRQLGVSDKDFYAAAYEISKQLKP